MLQGAESLLAAPTTTTTTTTTTTDQLGYRLAINEPSPSRNSQPALLLLLLAPLSFPHPSHQLDANNPRDKDTHPHIQIEKEKLGIKCQNERNKNHLHNIEFAQEFSKKKIHCVEEYLERGENHFKLLFFLSGFKYPRYLENKQWQKDCSSAEIFIFLIQRTEWIFFPDIDERRRYTKKVHPLKPWVGPSIVKRRRRGDLWAGQGLKVSVDAGLKHFKVISRGEEGGWE